MQFFTYLFGDNPLFNQIIIQPRQWVFQISVADWLMEKKKEVFTGLLATETELWVRFRIQCLKPSCGAAQARRTWPWQHSPPTWLLHQGGTLPDSHGRMDSAQNFAYRVIHFPTETSHGRSCWVELRSYVYTAASKTAQGPSLWVQSSGLCLEKAWT